jgi:hypothetical protein
MKRRTFFSWAFVSWVVQLVKPQWSWAGSPPSIAEQPVLDPRMLRAIAGAVLPASVGDAGLTGATNAFRTWIMGYQAGAEMSAGYGLTQIQVVPPDPSGQYAEQLADLERRARQRGRSFVALDVAAQRTIIAEALTAAAVETLPRRPNGRHLAADLMSHFYFVSSDGQDFVYNASIRRATCRGLSSSGARPAPLG